MADIIVISGWIDVDPAARDELLAASVPLQQSTRDDEPGCEAYAFSADPVVDGRILVYEQWAIAGGSRRPLPAPQLQGHRRTAAQQAATRR